MFEMLEPHAFGAGKAGLDQGSNACSPAYTEWLSIQTVLKTILDVHTVLVCQGPHPAITLLFLCFVLCS